MEEDAEASGRSKRSLGRAEGGRLACLAIAYSLAITLALAWALLSYVPGLPWPACGLCDLSTGWAERTVLAMTSQSASNLQVI